MFVMATVNAEVTDKMEQFIESEVEKGFYKSKSEYIRNKIKDDMKKSNGGELE